MIFFIEFQSSQQAHYVNLVNDDHSQNPLIKGYDTNNYQNFMLKSKSGDLGTLQTFEKQQRRPVRSTHQKRQAPLPPPLMIRQSFLSEADQRVNEKFYCHLKPLNKRINPLLKELSHPNPLIRPGHGNVSQILSLLNERIEFSDFFHLRSPLLNRLDPMITCELTIVEGAQPIRRFPKLQFGSNKVKIT
jgi:hypothetical protein